MTSATSRWISLWIYVLFYLIALMRNWSSDEIVQCSLWNTLTWWNGREIRFWWNRFARDWTAIKPQKEIVLQFCSFHWARSRKTPRWIEDIDLLEFSWPNISCRMPPNMKEWHWISLVLEIIPYIFSETALQARNIYPPLKGESEKMARRQNQISLERAFCK